APVWDARVLELAVAETLELSDQTDRPVSEVLAGYLSTRELLLLLDGCEHLLDASARFIEEMLRQAPGLRVLCTSRQPLGLVGAPGAGGARRRRRHRDWYLRVARRFDADWFGPGQYDWLHEMRRDRGNLHAALRFSLATPAEAPAALELATRLMRYWYASGL